jgi:sRNA-binding carbon storage regulator CsrA
MIKKLRKILALDGNENRVRLDEPKARRVSREEFMQLVQKKSYELYEKRGCQPGNDLEDWLNAERLVKEDLGVK